MSKTKFDSPLNHITVASPCPADWDQMYGDDRKRFCGDCKLNVYNLSGMTRGDAERLIAGAEGRMCVRYFQRRDGTVITQDCPVGWARIKQRTRVFATAALSMLMALFSGVLLASFFTKQRPTVGTLKVPYSTPEPTPPTLMGMIEPISNTSYVPDGNYVQGNIAYTPPPKGRSKPGNSAYRD